MEKEIRIPGDVMNDNNFKKLRLSSRYFYCFLAKLKGDGNGWFQYPMAQLSIDAGMNLKTIKRAKKELLENSFIKIRRGKVKGSNKRSADYYKVLRFER